MRLLRRSQLRFVAHAPWSAATALAGVALGVASVVAVHLISAAVVDSLDAATPPHLAGLSHVLERPGIDAEAYFSLRERWRALGASDVEALVPLVEGRVSLGERQVLVLGVDWLAMPASRESVEGTDPLTVSTDVLVGESVLADESLDLDVGDPLTMGMRHFRIAGVGDTGLGAALVADIAAAHHMLGSGPQAVHRVGLAVHDLWEPWRRRLDRLMPGFSAGLPAPRAQDLETLAPGLTAGPNGEAAGGEWSVSTVADQQPSAEFARAVLFNLGALGTLALLVAWFLIYQVGVIWLRRQHLVLERLQAIGASQRALRRSFLEVFAAIGGIATLVGLIVGVLLAGTLAELAAEGVEVEGTLVAGLERVDVWVVAKAFLSGFGVCLLGGIGAFRREWRRRETSRGWWWMLAPVLILVMAAGLLIDATGVLGGFLAIFAMSLIGVVLVSPALAGLRRVTSREAGSLLTRLALRDVAWHPRMLGVALAALSLAVATSIGVALMVESFRLDFDRMLDVRLAGDLYLDVGQEDAEALRAWLDAQPGVARVGGFGRGRVRAGGIPVELGYSRFDAAESARYGYPRALAAGEALISERLARDLDAGPGDRLPVAHGSLTVVGVFAGYGDTRGRLLVDFSSLDRLGLDPHVDRLTVELGSGVSADDLAREITRGFPTVDAEPRAELRALVLEIFDRTFAITQALTLVALLVAVVGTYNALTALRLHQASTAALLRAQGVTRGEERRITLIRAATVGGVAMALALPLGLAMAWTLCTVINPRSFGWTIDLHLPPAAWLSPLLLGLVAAALAGILPAPRERGALHEGA